MSMGVSDCYVHVGTLARWHAAVIGLWVGVIHTKRQGGHLDKKGKVDIQTPMENSSFP